MRQMAEGAVSVPHGLVRERTSDGPPSGGSLFLPIFFGKGDLHVRGIRMTLAQRAFMFPSSSFFSFAAWPRGSSGSRSCPGGPVKALFAQGLFQHTAVAAAQSSSPGSGS